MRRHDVRVRPQSSAARVLEWAGLSAADLEKCAHRPAEYNAEEERRMHEAPAPCALVDRMYGPNRERMPLWPL